MAFKEMDEKFKVETLEKGKKDNLGDRHYAYKIMTDESKDKVLEFCVKKLKYSYPKNKKPNGLSPEMTEFRITTSLGKTSMYSYKVKVFKTS